MEIGQIRGSPVPLSLRNRSSHVPKSSTLSSSITPTSTNSEKRMFIIGMGFVGQFLAHKLHNQGWSVSGTCTNHVKKKQLEDIGFHVHLFNANHPQLSILGLIKNYSHLLVSVPPVMGVGDPVLQHEELIRSSLVSGSLQWLCYLSSTSVYGDCDGELVDEDYPANPESELAKLRLASEEGWSNLAHCLGISPLLFRLGGIYGPGRSAIDTILKQGPLSKGQKMRNDRKYTSRVHVEDICQALMATIYAPSPREVYNIVDDDPTPREQVFAYARKLVEKKWPGLNLQPPEQKEFSVVRTRNPRGEKQVSNARMKKELGVQLLYPDYKSGLQSIIDQIHSPFPGH
ncbi:putative NAD(P)-binding domain-containing protein [Lupinus albus]|uniref:Putative NAD(P)-binding domain-containing protein n=1 Tax=Lupinus albus TaxID=3870 RepID=A0A6A4NLD1_LUPAL|nr:putative NAD(P)-binding domain-containing protein [Lupinus albus]